MKSYELIPFYVLVSFIASCGPEKSAQETEGETQSTLSTSSSATTASTAQTEPTGGSTTASCERREAGSGLSPNFRWSIGCGPIVFGPPSVAIATDGALFAAYVVRTSDVKDGVLNLGGDDLALTGGEDIIMVKFQDDGIHAWSQIWGNSEGQAIAALAPMPDGGVAALFYTGGQVTIGGKQVSAVGPEDSVIVALDSSGSHRWDRVLTPDAPPGTSGFTMLSTASNGALVAIATLNGSVKIGLDGPFVGEDRLLVVFESDGSLRRADVRTYASVVAMSLDGSIVVGTAGGSSAGDLERIDGDGNATWKIDGWATEESSIAVSQAEFAMNGDIVVAGHFFGTVNLGGDDLINPDGPLSGVADVFIARFDSDGMHKWSLRLDAPDESASMMVSVASLSLDASDQAFLIYGDLQTRVDVFGTDGSLIASTELLAPAPGGGGPLSDGTAIIVGWSFEPVDFGGGALPLHGDSDLWGVRIN